MYQVQQRKKFLFIGGCMILLFLFLIIFFVLIFLRSPEREAVQVVEEFYDFEQEGIFAESWELFHPYMQEKFSKGHYIQDRAHVFMNHFDVVSFSYSIGEVEKVENWTMEESREPIDLVYKMTIYQEYNGKYGKMTIMQDVYVTQVEEEWKIMWDYSS
ncbi:hypothetical protein [Oceanobacillus senegalensis]|uniref:hypothetical protein n=1 Tax=Oceanobacillus senegalensis TaxID=1936063 RepID=UPI001FEB4FB7|nr:hypothetical protein [Oceanobacillus senegalensis]